VTFVNEMKRCYFVGRKTDNPHRSVWQRLVWHLGVFCWVVFRYHKIITWTERRVRKSHLAGCFISRKYSTNFCNLGIGFYTWIVVFLIRSALL